MPLSPEEHARLDKLVNDLNAWLRTQTDNPAFAIAALVYCAYHIGHVAGVDSDQTVGSELKILIDVLERVQ